MVLQVFTHLLPGVCTRLTQRNGGGCSLGGGPGSNVVFLSTASGVRSLAAGRFPSCLLLGLPVPHVCFFSRLALELPLPRAQTLATSNSEGAEERSCITPLLCPNATTVAGIGYRPIIHIGICLPRWRSWSYRGGAMLALLAFDGYRRLESQASPRAPALLD